MQTHPPGHRLHSGPFALGANLDKQAVCFTVTARLVANAMELGTAVRHTRAGGDQSQRRLVRRPEAGKARPRAWLHALRQMAEALDYVGKGKVEDIRPALERAQQQVDKGSVA